ncbi:hypothetical protein HNR19_003618 [Nocardioides thalensis]|uniref:Heavy-metal-associated domain-containing protein n=1 Tax=Nocardioides thalensis TaxID=1914755 RepID=A0A853C477_9ACTN|nr:hypothetical protein [Nocardioides thalensis]NYJ02920.1 hypothetical protein [Nocardioides thalensis]
MLTQPIWRISAFAVGLAVVLAAGIGIGRAVGPIETDDGHTDAHSGPDSHSEVIHVNPADPAASYSLAIEDPSLPAGRSEVAFTVVDADGEPLTAYDVAHGKELHLILARFDLGGYRHVHPELDEATGGWTVPVSLEDGSWRVYADFAPAGEEATLAEADLTVGTGAATEPLGPDTATDTVDGYEVHLTREGAAVTLHVTKDGREVTDLQPYLGAYGHLVAIRAEDLAYLHVHPEDGPSGPEIGFHAEFTEPGRYRLFLDFKHEGVVRTAVFTITAEGTGGTDAPEEEHGGDHGDDHDDEQQEEEGGHEH